MRHTPPLPVSGQQLIADYQTAMVTASTAQAAQFAAQESETSLLSHLESISSGRYLQPGTIQDDEQAGITRASLDAHFKKVQAQQMDAMSAAQLQQLTYQDQQQFAGRRVKANVLGGATDVIEIVSFNSQTGYHTSPVNRRTIGGIIETVLLDRNLLVLRPNLGVRLVNSSIQNYLVYMIDPATMLPLVDLRFV